MSRRMQVFGVACVWAGLKIYESGREGARKLRETAHGPHSDLTHIREPEAWWQSKAEWTKQGSV